MNFENLYHNGIILWPNEVKISDGHPTSKTGYLFPELTRIYNSIEDGLDVEDGWSQIIVWSMFQAFHSASKQLIRDNKEILNIHLVPKSEVEWRVMENLKGEGWESLLE